MIRSRRAPIRQFFCFCLQESIIYNFRIHSITIAAFAASESIRAPQRIRAPERIREPESIRKHRSTGEHRRAPGESGVSHLASSRPPRFTWRHDHSIASRETMFQWNARIVLEISVETLVGWTRNWVSLGNSLRIARKRLTNTVSCSFWNRTLGRDIQKAHWEMAQGHTNEHTKAYLYKHSKFRFKVCQLALQCVRCDSQLNWMKSEMRNAGTYVDSPTMEFLVEFSRIFYGYQKASLRRTLKSYNCNLSHFISYRFLLKSF